jgi:hypothetical protein
MTKAEMVDQIEFVLSELAGVRIELRRIDEAPISDRRPDELHAESVARTLGRCQEMAHNAEIFLTLAVDNLRLCLADPKKPIAPFFATRMATARPSAPDLSEPSSLNKKEKV